MERKQSIKQIAGRYYLPGGLIEEITPEELKRTGLDPGFFQLLIDILEENCSFRESDFDSFSLGLIIDYLRKSHTYYLTKKLPEIEQSIFLVGKDKLLQGQLYFQLSGFYAMYRNKLQKHIGLEEEQLLPYIDHLLATDAQQMDLYGFWKQIQHYSLQQFVDDHEDMENDLKKLRESILELNPPYCDESPFRILVMQLNNFERDLSIHDLIEENVLIPRARMLEGKLMEEFRKRVVLN